MTVRWLAEVHVALRSGIADPEGQTIGSALRALGYPTVSEVRSGKLMRIAFEAPDHGAAEGGARLPPCHAVDGQPMLGLEGPNGALGPGPADPVHRVGVEAERAHRHLQSGDVGAARAGLRRNDEQRRGHSGEQCEKLSGSRRHQNSGWLNIRYSLGVGLHPG